MRLSGYSRSITVGGDQLAGHFVGNHAVAAHDTANGGGQRIALYGLEQISTGAGAQGGGKVVLVFAHREHDHPCQGRGLAQSRQGVNAIDAGKMIVEQDQIWL